MKLTVNGEPREIDGQTIPDLLVSLDIHETRGVALAVNGAVVPKSKWDEAELAEGDEVEIIRATQGG